MSVRKRKGRLSIVPKVVINDAEGQKLQQELQRHTNTHSTDSSPVKELKQQRSHSQEKKKFKE